MPDSITVRITGADELARALTEKPPIVAREIIRTSLRDAAQPWREEMIQRVRRGWHVFQHAILRGKRGQGTAAAGREREYGVIASHILTRVRVGASGFDGSATVYPSKRAFWALFLEFGTRKMRSFPFMRPSFEARKEEVLDRFIEDVRAKLQKDLGLH